ncbi:DUF433 domain-containing protein [Dyadobacter fermentans]|uniref:DUF433 domain-containing protein n=1 Tax=Dyadobacter fermentans (strain ATCC 700827 / DSM 18053 / CIP 107007 / KCTC 52180 / NS114) TaxID=471854 RepID=C6W3X2_DYAFD|nr:DUF433 domain-containing protein [Dyadobacter fermentans]ACT95820.1 protein of unknown function DUF433 [Dyadobacter fermentans DSM 18053]
MTTYITERIAIDPDICNGKPIIRGMRITVQTVLEFLFAGTTRDELLYQYPALENEDIDACFEFTIEMMNRNYFIKDIKHVA